MGSIMSAVTDPPSTPRRIAASATCDLLTKSSTFTPFSQL
jgi:hypothetical protein